MGWTYVMDIKDKRILITGGAVRIGAAFCRAFAHGGARVVEAWSLFGVVKFTTKDGTVETVYDNIKDPEWGYIAISSLYRDPIVSIVNTMWGGPVFEGEISP